MQNKKCKSCGEKFIVRDEDEKFYRKISPTFNRKTYEIPTPKFCPTCRERRRLSYRNERKLFCRKSSLSGEEMISVFSTKSHSTVYTREEWWGDKWDPLDYGQILNKNQSFFDQFYSLQLKVPRPPLVNNKATNSEYCNFADGNKNCYMLTSVNRNEDCYYGFLMVENRSCAECLWCTKSELLYECVDCRNCYNCSHAQDCENCVDSDFIFNCRGLNNCLFCVNLNNKRYHVRNKPVSKEEFERYKAKATKEEFEKVKNELNERKSSTIISSENCVGNNIFHSKNVFRGFDIYESRDVSYSHDGLKATDCSDICFFDGTELCYESTSLIGYGYRFTNFCRDSYNLFYCDNCHSCKNCFGCVGLRRKEYCVFNKQYDPDEYEKTVSGIIEHMIETGEWGEFFPEEKSIFPYEDTLANDYFPL